MNLKQKMLSGEKIYGTMLRIVRNPAVCHLIKQSGLDFVMYDCEHSNYSMETLHDLFITGNLAGYASFLRVPAPTKDYISRALDQGATGVMVPMCETGEITLELVKYSKYQPVGGRGYSASIAHTNYTSGKHAEIMARANDTVISIAQIETKLSIDNADSIAATPGTDALLIGPNDLSISLGIPGDLMNKIELEAIAHVAAACKRHGKAFGLHAGIDLLKIFYDDLTLVMSLTDTDIILGGLKNIRQSCENLGRGA